MSGAHDAAVAALKELLWELPAEFTQDPSTVVCRSQFSVIKHRNVAKVHAALYSLQEYFGMTED